MTNVNLIFGDDDDDDAHSKVHLVKRYIQVLYSTDISAQRAI